MLRDSTFLDNGDDGLSTITKTDSGSGVTLTASNPNANGGNFQVDNNGLALGTVNTFGNGISQFDLSFSQAVTLNSYVVGYLQQIAIKHVCVQNAKTLHELDLVTHPCGGLALKLL